MAMAQQPAPRRRTVAASGAGGDGRETDDTRGRGRELRDLSALMDETLGATPEREPIENSGPNCERLLYSLEDRFLATQTLATYFWWSFVHSRLYAESTTLWFGRLGAPYPVIVTHAGGTRLNLLLIDADYSGPQRQTADCCR